MSDKNYPSSEYELLSELQAILGSSGADGAPYELTLGDDAAIRRCERSERMVLTTDIAVENVHFSLSTMSMREIGFRTMVANLSDCAAMGAIPEAALVQLVFPRSSQDLKKSIAALYEGFVEACREWNFRIIGGDLAGGAAWTIGITLLGTAPPHGRLLRRKGVCPGDRLWISGFPGRSAAGLAALQKWGRSASPECYRHLVECHIRPQPRIELGVALNACAEVHAMMDLSDGLSKDGRTLSFDNGLGLELSLEGLRAPEDMIALSKELDIPWQEWFLHGGEEYELLFAASSRFDPGILFRDETLHRSPPMKNGKAAPPSSDDPALLPLGIFTNASTLLVVRERGTVREIPKGSWDHVAQTLR